MAQVIAQENVNYTRKENPFPGGHRGWRTDFLLPKTDEQPQAFLAESTPGRVVDTHFHVVDQFQLVIKGGGSIGKHGLAPCGVHFARAYTPYGPLVNGKEGIAFFTLRAHKDYGAKYLPESREELMQTKDRKPWQISGLADIESLEPGPRGVAMKLVDQLKDDKGLAVYSLAMKPGVTAFAPDPSRGDGQYIVVTKGSLMHEGTEHRNLTVIFVEPTEKAFPLVAGSEGLEGIIMNFPVRSMKAAPANSTTESNGGNLNDAVEFKTWQCVLCSFVYDEAAGMPKDGIPPGTRWADVPETFVCPDCSATKTDFEMIEI